MKWFPDRRGMATGMAVMGFGGGAFVAGYLNNWLISSVGVSNTLMILAVIYLLVMLSGAVLIRRPPYGWLPAGYAAPMAQDMFSKTPAQAAGLVSIISLFNAGGRFFWATLSDFIGRRATYMVFFLAQFGLFLLILCWAQAASGCFLKYRCLSFSPCMAAALPPSPPSSPICSDRTMSAPFMVRFSPPGVWPRSWVPW